jgi:hypothetical protein
MSTDAALVAALVDPPVRAFSETPKAAMPTMRTKRLSFCRRPDGDEPIARIMGRDDVEPSFHRFQSMARHHRWRQFSSPK